MPNKKFTDEEWVEIGKEERRVLAQVAAKNDRFQKALKAGGAEVGIFWLLPSGKIILDGTPLSEAANYGDFKTHEGSHIGVWNTYRRNSMVPPDVEYDEYPRGRVVYSVKTRQFWLYADACILKNPSVVNWIMNEFHLPSNTKKEKDAHYKCPSCFTPSSKKQQEKDWDF
jgi:hypothetical protein